MLELLLWNSLHTRATIYRVVMFTVLPIPFYVHFQWGIVCFWIGRVFFFRLFSCVDFFFVHFFLLLLCVMLCFIQATSLRRQYSFYRWSWTCAEVFSSSLYLSWRGALYTHYTLSSMYNNIAMQTNERTSKREWVHFIFGTQSIALRESIMFLASYIAFDIYITLCWTNYSLFVIGVITVVCIVRSRRRFHRHRHLCSVSRKHF